jgi:uncharacterized protein RhaS with RHS repeats
LTIGARESLLRVLSRFLSPDPAGIAGGDVNMYAYAHDDPTNLTDPLGLSTGGVGGRGGGDETGPLWSAEMIGLT